MKILECKKKSVRFLGVENWKKKKGFVIEKYVANIRNLKENNQKVGKFCLVSHPENYSRHKLFEENLRHVKKENLKMKVKWAGISITELFVLGRLDFFNCFGLKSFSYESYHFTEQVMLSKHFLSLIFA